MSSRRNAGHVIATDHLLPTSGSCHILYTNFESEDNFITAPIFGRYSRPIGAVTFKYLVIRPLQNLYLSMARSRFYHYGAAHGPMIIGHRGMGKTHGPQSAPYDRFSKVQLTKLRGHYYRTVASCVLLLNNISTQK